MWDSIPSKWLTPTHKDDNKRGSPLGRAKIFPQIGQGHKTHIHDRFELYISLRLSQDRSGTVPEMAANSIFFE